jgi:uracil-DNA glycosylase
VYNTELTQCFPGKGPKSGDRAPNETEIATCLRQKFLEREVELLKPKLLILMGDKSRQAFYKYLVKKPRTDTLQTHMDRIISSGRIPKHQVGPLRVPVLPIQHASGANPNFYRMLENIPLLQLIRGVLALS